VREEMRIICASNAHDLVFEIKYSVKKNGVIMGRLVKKRGKTTLSGPAGNVDFYTFGGTTYFKARAKRHKKSRSKPAVRGRNNFASVVKFASGVIKYPGFKEIWDNSSLQGRNGYQKIIKHNMPLTRDGNLTINNFFTPKGHKLFIPDFIIEKDAIRFEFDVYGLLRPPLTMHMFFYLYNPKDTNSFVFTFMYIPIHIKPDDVNMQTKKGELKYKINAKLDKTQRTDLSLFKDVVVLLAVTGTPTIPNRKSWTNTVGFDIPLV
jgi:hypothetical protein